MSVSPGARFGSYEIAAGIGAGGMGEVFRARDTNLKRDVALKLLPKAFLEDRDRLARFQREAEILAALNHPNIAQVYGLEKADGQTAIVMELVEGPTLADRIAEGPIPPDEAMAIALQVVAALEAAHDKGIVHRDLKPANIKVREDGTVKVLDFGISKPIDAKLISGGTPVGTTPAMTQTGVILGTAAYMSPEQARGRFVDERTDIWAFGCLLFEMLTGQPAFGGEDMMAILARVIDRDTDLTSVPKTISPAVRHTISICLQKDPRKRIADIRDVRLALEGRFESASPGATAVAPTSPLRRALVHVGVLAAGVAAATVVAFALRSPLPATPSVEQWAVDLPDEFLPLTDALHPTIAVSAAGDLAYRAGGVIYYRPVGELEARRLDVTDGHSPSHLVFSPDGASIIYWSGERGALYRISTSGGSPVQIALAPLLPAAPSVTADGRLVYSQGPMVLSVPLTGSEAPGLLFDDSADSFIRSSSPDLLEDGETLLFSRDNIEVVAVSLDSGEVKELFPGSQPRFVAPGYILYVDGRGLFARAFDPENLLTGEPFEIAEAVLTLQGPARSGVQFSATPGTLAYIPHLLIDGSEAPASIDEISMSRLAIAGTDGSVEVILDEPRHYVSPSVSPDVSNPLVAFVISSAEALADADFPFLADGGQIFIYDIVAGTDPWQLTTEGAVNIDPEWRDGQTLYFSSNRGDGRRRIWEQRIDGSAAVRVSEPAEGFSHRDPAVTPDGLLAYLETGPDGRSRYMVKNMDGRIEPLLPSVQNVMGVAFSPDDDALAYWVATVSQTEGVPTFSIFAEPYPPSASNAPRLISQAEELAVVPVFGSGTAGSRLRLFYPRVTDLNNPSVDMIVADIALPGYRVESRTELPSLGPNVRSIGFGFDLISGTDRFVLPVSVNASAIQEAADSAKSPQIVVVRHLVEFLNARVSPIE